MRDPQNHCSLVAEPASCCGDITSNREKREECNDSMNKNCKCEASNTVSKLFGLP